MDLSRFGAPARVQILLVPIHPIKRRKFADFAKLISSLTRIPLCEIPPDPRGERGESFPAPG